MPERAGEPARTPEAADEAEIGTGADPEDKAAEEGAATPTPDPTHHNRHDLCWTETWKTRRAKARQL